MRQTLIVLVAGAWALALMVLGLWAWRNGEFAAQVAGARSIATVTWAVRCAGVAAIAGGEALLALVVVGNVWRRDGVTQVLGLSAAVVFLLSTASAVALGVAGQ